MITQCPVCGFRSLSRTNLPASLVRCDGCDALLNEQAYDRLATTALRQLQGTEFYQPERAVDDGAHWQRVATYEHVLDTLAANGAVLDGNGVFLDFGAGQGYAAIAASRRFRHSIICDMYPEISRTIVEALGLKNITVIDDLAKLPYRVDVLFMWHVLEHLPDPTAFWVKSRSILADRAELIVQVPMYRTDYVVDAHFVFFNEQSLRAWFSRIGGDLRTVLFDKENDFVTVIGNLT
jgi:hypothetical protein